MSDGTGQLIQTCHTGNRLAAIFCYSFRYIDIMHSVKLNHLVQWRDFKTCSFGLENYPT